MKIVTKQTPKGSAEGWDMGIYLSTLPPVVLKEDRKVAIESPEVVKRCFSIEGYTGLWMRDEEFTKGLRRGYIVENLKQDETKFLEEGTVVTIPNWIV